MSTDLLQGDCEFEAKPGPHREVQMLLRSRVVIPQCYLLTTCSKMSSALLCGFHSQGVFVVSKWTCSPCLNFSLKKKIRIWQRGRAYIAIRKTSKHHWAISASVHWSKHLTAKCDSITQAHWVFLYWRNSKNGAGWIGSRTCHSKPKWTWIIFTYNQT